MNELSNEYTRNGRNLDFVLAEMSFFCNDIYHLYGVSISKVK